MKGPKKGKVVMIEYDGDDQPHAAIVDRGGCADNYYLDFCGKDKSYLMWYNSGGGPLPTEIDMNGGIPLMPRKVWISKKYRHIPVNANEKYTIIDEPLQINGKGKNPFKVGHEVMGMEYCSICGEMYDEEGCPDHHGEYHSDCCTMETRHLRKHFGYSCLNRLQGNYCRECKEVYWNCDADAETDLELILEGFSGELKDKEAYYDKDSNRLNAKGQNYLQRGFERLFKFIKAKGHDLELSDDWLEQFNLEKP